MQCFEYFPNTSTFTKSSTTYPLDVRGTFPLSVKYAFTVFQRRLMI